MVLAEDFVWGAASAAYQIEGAVSEDGRGASVWDMVCRIPGKIRNGHTGDVACDHYHRYAEDVALMHEIGLGAYRFSVAWPRVIPGGTGKVNEKGLEFYDRLVDALLEARIVPWVTLFHWDYPYELFCRGGWLNRDSAEWFADYARVVVERLSDRVTHWITQNEQKCFIVAGLQSEGHAPSLKMGRAEVIRAAHHAHLAHGLAVQQIHAAAKSTPLVGIAPTGVVKIPVSETPEDIEAARAMMFSSPEDSLWDNLWWLDPLHRGQYPEDRMRALGRDAPPVRDGDMRIINQTLDFFAVNIYSGEYVRAGSDGRPETVAFPADRPITVFRSTPDALYWGARFFHERYGLPVFITENGMSNEDIVSVDGAVHDPQRIEYMRQHLTACRRAVDDGIPLSGYFYWSATDNFEWASGFNSRFGLIHIDYRTQRRTPKDSSRWYSDVIASHGRTCQS